MTNNLKQYGLEENKEMYEKHQKQRYFERNIRKCKRLLKTDKHALERTTDEDTRIKLKTRVSRRELLLKKWNRAYRNFSKENNLRTQPDRTRI